MSSSDPIDGDQQIKITVKRRLKLQEPPMFRVILLNDDYTTMEFVVEVLVNVFHKTEAQATQIMLDVHRQGKGVCGIYAQDIAITKVNQVRQMAKQYSFPLQCSFEEA